MLREICETWLREFLHVYYGSLQSLKQILRDRAPAVVNWLKMRRRHFVDRERAALFARLAADGASAEYIARFGAELAAIEEVLTGKRFTDFIAPYRPLLAAGAVAAPVAPPRLPQAAE